MWSSIVCRPRRHLVGETDVRRQVVTEVESCTGRAFEMAEQGHAACRQRLVAPVWPRGPVPDVLRLRPPQHRGIGRSCGRWWNQPASSSHGERVATTQTARRAADLSGREIHRAPRVEQILGDLAAGLRAADDEHRTGCELLGSPVLGGGEPLDLRVDVARDCRQFRRVLHARGDDDIPGVEPVARRRRDCEPARAILIDGAHLGVVTDGQAVLADVAL